MDSIGEMPTELMTEFSLNQAHRSGAEESRLSLILEEQAHQRYYLGSRACEGIIRRAERRGKELPHMLKTALEQMIEEDKSATLATNNDQHLFQPMSLKEENWAESGVKNALRAGESKVSHCIVGRLILDDQGGSQISVRTDGKSPTLLAEMHGNIPAVLESAGFKAGNGAKANGIGWEEEVAPTLASSPSGTNQVPAVVYRKGTRPHSAEEPQKWEEAEVANTLNAFDTGETRASELICYAVGNGQLNQISMSEVGNTLDCMHDKQAVLVEDNVEPISIDRAYFNQGQNAKYDPQFYTDGTVPTLVARGPSAVQVRYIVRRLTPMECERLQGFPDGWTDIGDWVDSKGKNHKAADSPRYKALGNSICLPPWKWVLKRLCAHYERDATMASLFDGIGGFPLIWEQLNGKGTCLWASEIEEFPMAVTKRRFGNAE